MNRHIASAAFGALALGAIALAPSTGRASLTLTAAAISDGFTLTTFATIDPGNANTFNFGPFGVAYAGNGDVIVSNYADSNIYSFADTDGQTLGSALAVQHGAGTSTVAMASVGNVAYGYDPATGGYAAYNSNGTINHALTGVTTSPYLGMAGNPSTGHIIATSSLGLIDINPTANGGLGSFRVIAAGVYGDGVSVSPDGKTVYLEAGGQVHGYSIATGAQTYVSSAPFPSLDGTGVISSTNSLNGDIIGNNNDGEIDLLNPTTNAFIVLASGGTRGDYTSADPTNGTLFLDYSDIIARLSCGANCTIGGPPPVPEPASFALLGSALLGLGATLRRRRG